MKVDSSRGVRPGKGAKAAKRETGPTGAFAQEMKDSSSAGAADEAAAPAPAGAIDALLAVQEVGDATSGRGNAQGRAWGNDVLDRLEEIRLGLLTGTITVARLETLARLVSQQRESDLDPRLAAILDDIELRARVELAKLGRSPGAR